VGKFREDARFDRYFRSPLEKPPISTGRILIPIRLTTQSRPANLAGDRQLDARSNKLGSAPAQAGLGRDARRPDRAINPVRRRYNRVNHQSHYTQYGKNFHPARRSEALLSAFAILRRRVLTRGEPRRD
jgi:hypothetical protein